MTFQEVELFLDSAGKKGFLTQSVLKQTLTAFNKMKSVVEEDPDKPEVDLTKSGVIEDLFKRFMTKKQGELSPESANVYVNRAKKAVDNCERYKNDPLSYKSTFGVGETSKSTSEEKPKEKRKNLIKNLNRVVNEPSLEESQNFTTAFPLRKDFMLNVKLPLDLNQNEVRRIAYHLWTLCPDFNPGKPNIFYHDGPQASGAIEGSHGL